MSSNFFKCFKFKHKQCIFSIWATITTTAANTNCCLLLTDTTLKLVSICIQIYSLHWSTHTEPVNVKWHYGTLVVLVILLLKFNQTWAKKWKFTHLTLPMLKYFLHPSSIAFMSLRQSSAFEYWQQSSLFFIILRSNGLPTHFLYPWNLHNVASITQYNKSKEK